MGRVAAESGGFVGETGGVQEMNGRVAKGRQDLGGRPASDPTGILSKRHVARPEQIVLNPPVRPTQIQQCRGIGPLPGKACDSVDDLRCGLPVEGSLPHQFKCLLQTRPIAVALQGRRAGDSPAFYSSVSLVQATGLLAFCVGQTAIPRGKRMSPTRR